MKVIRRIRPSDGKPGRMFFGFNSKNRPVFKYECEADWTEGPKTFESSKDAQSTVKKINKVLGAGSVKVTHTYAY